MGDAGQVLAVMSDVEQLLAIVAGGAMVGALLALVGYGVVLAEVRQLRERVRVLERAVEGDGEDEGAKCIYCGEKVKTSPMGAWCDKCGNEAWKEEGW